MSWRDIWVLYRFEVRAALRERSIVVSSILIPILLYPFLLWATFTGITFVQGQTEDFVSRVVLSGLPRSHTDLEELLAGDEDLEIQPTLSAEDGATALSEGRVDVVVEFLPPRGRATELADNFRVRLTHDSSKERSTKALDRLRDALEQYRDDWLQGQSQHLNVSAGQWQVMALQTRNVASGRQMGAFLLGLMLPIFFVIMVAVGCFHPAVDATAGERERNTWETTLTLATSRFNIVTAKYLYVVTFGCIAGVLNLTAMGISLGTIFAPLMEDSDQAWEFSVPLASIPILLIGSVLLAGFIAGGMMVFAAFARTFREGQSMIAPFYLLTLIPAVFLGQEGLTLSFRLALVPIVNVALMVREALSGSFPWPQIALTLGVDLVTVALCLQLAAFILRFEDVVIGSYSGNLIQFVRHRLGRGRTVRGGAGILR